MTEMKISRSAKFNADEITSIIKLAFGSVSDLKTTKSSYVFSVDGFRGNPFTVGSLTRYLGVDRILIDGKSIEWSEDMNGILKRREMEAKQRSQRNK